MLIDPSYLKTRLSYDPDTGEFTWLVADDVPKRWNKRWAGKKAGSLATRGYIQIGIKNKNMRANRIAYAMVTGSWPNGEVDHINLDQTDNRWANLRLSSRSENGQNRRKPRNNTTGYKGVCFDKSRGKYIATITVNWKRKTIGRYDTPEEAHAAYCKAAIDLHGDYHRLA